MEAGSRLDHWYARNGDRGASGADLPDLPELRRAAQRLRATGLEAVFRTEPLAPPLRQMGSEGVE